jgi:hypothetical protein
MDTTKISASRKLVDDFFRDIIPIAAVDIARGIAESRGLKGQQFDEEIRWSIQRELETFLEINPIIRTSVFDQNYRDRGRAVNVLMAIYEKFIVAAVPNTEVLIDRSF